MIHTPAIPADVLAAFQDIAPPHRQTLLAVRNMILEVAQSDPRIGEIEETLKWGDPAYVTGQSKSGSTIRLGVEKVTGQPALFFNCKTTLVESFRAQFGDALRYSKNRAVLLDEDVHRTCQSLRICIAAALTYHLKDWTL